MENKISHCDDATGDAKRNRGNYMDLLDFQADGGDMTLKGHLESAGRNANYT